MQFTPNEINAVPTLCGVYKYYNKNGLLLYVGKAKNLFKRINSYFNNKFLLERTLRMVEQIETIYIQVTQSETEALILENHLIRAENPKYNIIFRDDKSYPYLRITNHAFPRISSFRGKNQDNSLLFGPYPNSYSLRDNIQTLQKIFKLRSCEDTSFKNRTKPCILFQIKRCSAPCVGMINQNDYNYDIKQAIDFIKGNHKSVLLNLENKMLDFSKNMHYEQAAIMRDQITSLNELFKQQNIDIIKNINVDIIAYASTYNKFCLTIGIIRNGKHLGYKHFLQTLEINLQVDENLNSTSNAQLLNEQTAEIIKIYLEQQNEYINNKLNIKILSDLQHSHWNNIHEFLPALKAYNVKNDYTLSWLNSAYQNAELTLHNFLYNNNQTKQQLIALKQLLLLDNIKPHIECFDISHTSGEFTKASCIIFKNGDFERKNFRHYNIELKQKADDYKAINLALSKRYKGISIDNLPDIILIDGGKGQVNTAIQTFKSLNLPFKNIIGISKGEKRKVGLETLIFADGRESLTPTLNNLGLILLVKIRDEAHNYAILNMRKKRAKQQEISSLDKIDGIGMIKKKRLLASFGNVKNISQANIHELMQVHGINQELATRIYYYYHSE